jgi:hypothetical protein
MINPLTSVASHHLQILKEVSDQMERSRKYNLDSLKMSEMCEKYPSLETAWKQLKTLYDLCINEYENETRNP